MRCTDRIRLTRGLALAAALAGACTPMPAFAHPATGPRQQEAAPIERRPPSSAASPGGAQPGSPASPARRGVRGEHLAEWMNQHSNLSPQDQQRALELEPGFHDLPTQTQQRMRDRLAQLDAMPPQRRQRLLARTEAMERLNPEQRAQVRGAMSQLGSLPPDERRTVAQTFRSLRQLPPEQRVSAYASGRYGSPLNDADRSVLMNLLRVEPMLPPPAPGPRNGAGEGFH